MNKVLNRLIDLVFDNHCEMKEVSYHQDKLVCDNLEELKKDIKEVVAEYINEILKKESNQS
jgi:hypothetical protein